MQLLISEYLVFCLFAFFTYKSTLTETFSHQFIDLGLASVSRYYAGALGVI